MNFLLAVLAGFLAGIVTGMGVGGGTILMVYLTAIAGASPKAAQGINLLYFLPTAAAALIVHGKQRRIAWRIVLPAALCGSLAAAGMGYISAGIDLALMKKAFGGFLIVTGLMELFKKSS